MSNNLKSILDLLPFESGGRIARQGFTYQDHVGAAFCISLLENTTIDEIWFENLDDITLIHKSDDSMIVEFVQVKAHHPTSRWSVASITNAEKGLSIIEKSLNQCRCKETIKIRIVTCYDVNDDLKILTHFPESKVRETEIEKINRLEKEIVKKIGDSCIAPNGLTLYDWLKICYWDKRPDSLEAIENCNKIDLEKALKNKNINLLPEYRDELYQQILNKVILASTDDIIKNPDCYKLCKLDFESWLNERISDFQLKGRGINALETKMKEAGFDLEDTLAAKELKWAFLESSLENDYCEAKELKLMQNEIMSKVLYLKSKRYKNEVLVDGIGFHNLCIESINELLNTDLFKNIRIPPSMAHGYFYEIADRCLIRFEKK